MDAAKLLLIVLISLPVYGQSAKVMPLSPEDALKAKTLEENWKQASKEMEDFKNSLKQKYLMQEYKPTKSNDFVLYEQSMTLNGKEYVWKPGWNAMFEYSDDFKYIVPSKVEQKCWAPTNQGYYCGATNQGYYIP